jgi:hypothetical protein
MIAVEGPLALLFCNQCSWGEGRCTSVGSFARSDVPTRNLPYPSFAWNQPLTRHLTMIFCLLALCIVHVYLPNGGTGGGLAPRAVGGRIGGSVKPKPPSNRGQSTPYFSDNKRSEVNELRSVSSVLTPGFLDLDARVYTDLTTPLILATSPNAHCPTWWHGC